ncbi:UNVERIFIED_CONTAM: MLO-like protein 3, partial [Sesamum indicum]
MAGGGGSTNRSLQETPTWALATVCFVFIFLGIFIEYLIHLAGHWLKKHKKAALYEAIEKLKSVLMQLGFMSLILTVTQRWISKICVPDKVANFMLPCRSQTPTKTPKALQHFWISFGQKQPQTFEDFKVSHHRRALAAAASDSIDHCGSK